MSARDALGMSCIDCNELHLFQELLWGNDLQQRQWVAMSALIGNELDWKQWVALNAMICIEWIELNALIGNEL